MRTRKVGTQLRLLASCHHAKGQAVLLTMSDASTRVPTIRSRTSLPGTIFCSPSAVCTAIGI